MNRLVCMDNDEVVTIPKSKYQQLVTDSYFLSCLRRSGVDNWDGYEFAQDLFNGDEE